jgi:putative aldouronate transport system substrate-binding protein
VKKRYFGILAAMLAGAMTLTGCSGNNSSSEGTQAPTKEPASSAQAIDTSKPVKLRMILIGAKPTDTDKVYEKVNAILKEKVNATIEPIFYDWGDWKTKYPLAFASGENFDLIYTANWAFYSEQAAKGGFLELTDQMLKKYAPQTSANVTADQWVQTKFNGKIYMVPYTNKEYGIGKMAIVRGDLREKYSIPKVTDMASMTRYMETIAEKEKGLLAYNAGGSDGVVWLKRALFEIPNSYGTVAIGGQELPIAVDIKSSAAKGTIELVDLFENKGYREYLEKAKAYRQKGLWSQSALSNKTTNDVSFDNGASATYIRQPLNIAQAFVKNSEAHPDWKLEIVDLYPDIPLYTNSVLANGMAVHATSGNPERALMVLDLLRHDKQLNDLTTLGIEGVHWEAVGDTQYKLLAANSNFAPDSACPWGWRTELYRTNAAFPAQVVDVLNKVQEKGSTPVSSLFTFNSNSVKTEAAAVAAVAAVHRPMLDAGFVDDIDGALAQYKEKLKSAGYDKLIEEYKAQAAAFVASYGK